jgi:hypothetical protein
MTLLRASIFVATAALSAMPSSTAEDSPQTPSIEALVPKLQGRGPAKVRALIIEKFGPPAREVGSGLRIEQWDVDGGVLTFHPLTGPTFDNGGVCTRLIRTTNLVAQCLFGSYEMVTLPEGPHGMSYWLGSVSLSSDSHYEYTDGRQNPENRAGQRDNFFMLNPAGSTKVRYASDVTPRTRLEDLPDRSTVATVTFVARNRRAGKSYRIVAYRCAMALAFEGEAMSFQMDRGWVNYWR